MSKAYYTYISYDKDDNFYIGSTSCTGKPEEHQYYGSGSAIWSGEFKPIRKLIVATYKTRELAGLAEMRLINGVDYRNNPRCFNRYCAGSNQTGEAGKRMSEACKGKAKSEAHKAKLSKAMQGQNHPRFDNRLHKFVREDGREIVGLYKELRAKAKQIFGFSAGSVQNLKEGKCQSVNGWGYAGIVG